MFTNPADAHHRNYRPGRAILIVLISFVLLLAGCVPAGVPTRDQGIEVQLSPTIQPTSTFIPIPTDTSLFLPTETSIPPTPTLGIGAQKISDKDGMTLMYVPAGEFTMGSEDDVANARPVHTVYLDAFWMDKNEISNRQYAMCVSEGSCALPLLLKSPMRSSYYDDPQFANYPVVYVEWLMAVKYCEWAGRRLPTEAEWEKAARGDDGRIYPWGNSLPNDGLLNYNSPTSDTTEVGKYPNGQSPYQLSDMAGNVWEWVSDWYDSSYYQRSPHSNPLGPDLGEANAGPARVLRGGSWYYDDNGVISIFRWGVIPVNALVRSDLRSWSIPVYADTSPYGRSPKGFGTVGFRCAMSATP